MLPHLTLTSEDPPYDPYDPSFAAEEAALTKHLSETGDRIGAPQPSRRLCSVSNMVSFMNGLQLGLAATSLSLQRPRQRLRSSPSPVLLRLSGLALPESNSIPNSWRGIGVLISKRPSEP
ncbi:hypothetical protein MHU86_19980 [Fragilaria crotonensis]|nr:hypothetical protein MHU86_19980 [Fragilaria crotonensis]